MQGGTGVGTADPGVPQPLKVRAARVSQVFQDTLASDLYQSSLVSAPGEQMTMCHWDGVPGMGMRSEGARGRSKFGWGPPSPWARFTSQH